MHLAHYLRLVRVGTLFSPMADVVAGACLAGRPWSPDLIAAAAASLCVYAGGMILNDHADRAEDALRRPERPIPRGDVAPGTALVLGLAMLLAGVALSPVRPLHAALAMLVIAYDYALKRHPAAAAVAMGALRAGNLLVGTTGAAFIGPDDPALSTLAFGIAGAYGLYIAAVTLLGVLEDDPRAPARAVVGLAAVPPLASVAACAALPQRWPALALVLALAWSFAIRVRRHAATWDQAAIRATMTWLLVGTLAFDALVCLGSGRWPEALAVGAAVWPARWISRRIALT